MSLALGFDVYGTLVDPLQLEHYLDPYVGDNAAGFAQKWRATQLEYAFRRSMMREYANFDVCTEDALEHTRRAFDVRLGKQDMSELLQRYRELEPYPDVLEGLRALRNQGHTVVAFSNGTPDSLRSLLSHSGILRHLDNIVSVDDVRTYKPDPAVYRHLVSRVGRPLSKTWLVSSNYWDVVGAKAAGLQAAWVQRSPANVPDPWGMEPDLVISNLSELPTRLATVVS